MPTAPIGFAFTFLILRAFAEGCVAMTGTEAISNGVGAFKNPRSRNAAITLTWMAVILAVFFMGTSELARHFAVMPSATETVLSQLGRRVFGMADAILRTPVRHVRHPRAGREHCVRRLPAAGEHSRARRLHAAPVRGPWRPIGVLERHHRAGTRRHSARLAVCRRHQRAHSAVRDRRVRLLHAIADRHGGALGAEPRARLAVARDAQRTRRARRRR